jgi:hypothetical protein
MPFAALAFMSSAVALALAWESFPQAESSDRTAMTGSSFLMVSSGSMTQDRSLQSEVSGNHSTPMAYRVALAPLPDWNPRIACSSSATW